MVLGMPEAYAFSDGNSFKLIQVYSSNLQLILCAFNFALVHCLWVFKTLFPQFCFSIFHNSCITTTGRVLKHQGTGTSKPSFTREKRQSTKRKSMYQTTKGSTCKGEHHQRSYVLTNCGQITVFL